MIGESLFEESSLRIGYVICFVTAIGFVCSLTYNYGYFWSFEAGIRILSIGDILTSYSLWVPGLSTLIFATGLDLFLQRIEKKETQAAKKHKRLLKNLFRIPHIILVICMSIILIAYFIFGYDFRPIIIWFACGYVWFSLSGALYNMKLFKGRTNQYLLGIFLFIPIILSLMFALGLDQAKFDSKLKQPNANIYFIGALETKTPVILLRHLERGLLAKEINNRNYQLFTWDDISSIEIIASSASKYYN